MKWCRRVLICQLLNGHLIELKLHTYLKKGRTWLIAKAEVLSGGDEILLRKVARNALVKRVLDERIKDKQDGEFQKIQASVTSLEILDQTNKRIAAKAKLIYKDQ